MKSLKTLCLNITVLALFGFTLSSCFKQDINPSGSEYSILEQLAIDELSVDAADDDMWDDMNNFLDAGGYKSTGALPCNVKDSVKIIGDTVIHTLQYNGVNCIGTRFRSGQVIMKHNKKQRWGDQGAKVFVTMKNYKLTRMTAGKSIILNGNKIYENISGGRVSEIKIGGNLLVQRGMGLFSVTFDSATTQTWEMARQRIFKGAIGNILVISTGFGSMPGYNYLVYWGSNRTGVPFLSQIISNVIYRENCTGFPCEGKKILMLGGAKNNVINFGFNDNNKPVTGTECPTKLQLEWQAVTLSGSNYIKL
jgi:RNase P/RNase MRP subunit p29